MTAIGTLGPGNSDVAAMPETLKTSPGNAREPASTEEATPTLVEGVKVSLSGASIAKAASVGGETATSKTAGCRKTSSNC